jgi:hypothetical protein
VHVPGGAPGQLAGGYGSGCRCRVHESGPWARRTPGW